MTKLASTMVVVLLVAFASPARAGLGPNGLGPNGLGPNGLGPNGLGPNGLGPNGLGPNGLGPNGLGPNGLGPNGLGPNGLGPNGLDVNGLGPNGLGPNGLGPNGLPYTFYVVQPSGQTQSDFKAWFEADAASASKFMGYFVRCSYDGNTGIAYLDSTGKTWAWTGQYGLAMESLKTTQVDPILGVIRGRMTLDEGKWVSACLLAHVNLQGTHQYVSLRGSPPNPEGQAALLPSTNEIWAMNMPFGDFFGDLFGGYDAAGNPTGSRGAKYACVQNGAGNWYSKIDTVIGRNCDVEQCTYPDPANPAIQLPVLTHIGACGFQGGVPNPTLPDGSPLYAFHVAAPYSTVDPWWWYRTSDFLVGSSAATMETFHPIAVNGARPIGLTSYKSWGAISAASTQDVALCDAYPGRLDYLPWCTAAEAPYRVPIDAVQVADCGPTSACFNGLASDPRSYKLVGLRAGQALDPMLGFSVTDARYMGMPSYLPDMNEPFTAIIRYQKDRTGTAHVATRGKDGAWKQLTSIGERTGPDVWKATDPGKWEWMQVYPTYLTYDTQVTAFAGRYCNSADGVTCPSGYTCDTLAYTCRRPAPVPTCDPATGACASTCGVNEYPFTMTSLGPNPTSSDVCVLQCTASSECGHGQACVSGKCSSPSMKIRLSGADMSESCTGVELFKGANEQGTCSKPFARWPPRSGAVCPRANEGTPQCRGKLAWTKRKGVWGWYCRGGGEALYACTAADAPDLDSVAFIPGKPWCAKPGATSFLGVCQDAAAQAARGDDVEEENELE